MYTLLVILYLVYYPSTYDICIYLLLKDNFGKRKRGLHYIFLYDIMMALTNTHSSFPPTSGFAYAEVVGAFWSLI